MNKKRSKSVALIVAHPDDETLWAGGMILEHSGWELFILCLCRADDADRAPKFFEVLQVYKAKGIMGDLDDGPDQKTLDVKDVERAIIKLIPEQHFDLIISHNPSGEYTRHRRHEEVSKAVIELWQAGNLSADELWTFAYEDDQKKVLPKAVKKAPLYRTLPAKIMKQKYQIITQVYGFTMDSWEARTTPKSEAFWRFTHPAEAKQWLDQGGVLDEGISTL